MDRVVTGAVPVVDNEPRAGIVGRSVWSGSVVHYTGEFWIALPAAEFWQVIEDFEQYQEWWPWLDGFSSDQPGLVAGNVLQATVVPPVPYRVRLSVRFESCERPSLAVATISGDLRGRASLSFDERRGGTRVRADWTLDAATTTMRIAAKVARPLMRWGHDRVVEMAVAGIQRRVQP